MGFGDLSSDAGLKALNDYLLSRSYIEGYQPSQADVAIHEAVKSAPDGAKFTNVLRWFNHVSSYSSNERAGFPGQKKSADQYGDSQPAAAAPAAGDDDDDDFDLFGSDTEEDIAERERIKQQRLAEYAAKKAKKPVLIAKSSIVLDVKPWDDETDMSQMEKNVRSIKTDGLVWGTANLVPVGYGIKKLQITCVVEDDKVGTDFLEEEITAFEDLVQSVDVVAFNKI